MQSHLRQHFFDFVQRFATEIRRAQHFGFGFLNQIADVHDAVVFQTVRGTHGQLQFVDFAQQVAVERQFVFLFGFHVFFGFFEIDIY